MNLAMPICTVVFLAYLVASLLGIVRLHPLGQAGITVCLAMMCYSLGRVHGIQSWRRYHQVLMDEFRKSLEER